MQMRRESRIALDRAVHAPHRWGVSDEKTHPVGGGRALSGKDARLAAALRANLSRRKAAARQDRTGDPRPLEPKDEEG
jgi:hypothetical protein